MSRARAFQGAHVSVDHWHALGAKLLCDRKAVSGALRQGHRLGQGVAAGAGAFPGRQNPGQAILGDDDRERHSWNDLLVPGVILALLHVSHGVFLLLTIIGIPLALQDFKIAGPSLFPLGKRTVTAPMADEVRLAVARHVLTRA